MTKRPILTDHLGNAYTRIGGVEFKIASLAEIDEANALIVCGPVSFFPDDIHTLCGACGAPVVHRPYMPTRLVKVCFRCFKRLTSSEES